MMMLCTELGLEPKFDEMFTNVTVVAGHTATLPCSIDFLGKHKVHSLYKPLHVTVRNEAFRNFFQQLS